MTWKTSIYKHAARNGAKKSDRITRDKTEGQRLKAKERPKTKAQVQS